MRPHSDRRGVPGESASSSVFFYHVYGLIVVSEIELPELVKAEPQQSDVQIRFGEVPETVPNPIARWYWCSASCSEFVFTIDGVARYRVSDGRLITVDRRLGVESSVPSADIRLWLLGSAFAALTHQRGLLPLHVSAIKAPTGVWAFAGESGEGKSTLAGFLHRRRGWGLVSDDVSVSDLSSAEPVIYPGPRKLKLWADALQHLEFAACKVVRDLSSTDKFQLYMSEDEVYEPEMLKGLIVLESGDDDEAPTIKRLTGMLAFKACLEAVYRPYMASWYKLPNQRVQELATICSRIEVYRFRRPRSLNNFEHNLGPVIDLIGSSESS